MPRKLPLYLSDLQALTAVAILPKALRRAGARRRATSQPALKPGEVQLLCGLHVLSTVNRGGIRASELRAARLMNEKTLTDAITSLIGQGYISRSRRVVRELVLYTVTPKGSEVLGQVLNAILHEARELWHVLASGVIRSKPTDKRYKYRRARRIPPSPTPLSHGEGPEPTPTADA